MEPFAIWSNFFFNISTPLFFLDDRHRLSHYSIANVPLEFVRMYYLTIGFVDQ